MNTNIKFIGFNEEKEFLCKDFDTFNSEVKLRQMFLNLSNNILKPVCNFTRYEQRNLAKNSLKNAFIYKINQMLPFSYLKKPVNNFSFNLCIKSTKIINNYLNKENKNIFFVSNTKLLPAAKLILHCYINNSIQVLIDKHLLFHEFVLYKVKRMHKDKEVIDLGDSISIKAKDICSLKIYTSWKSINTKKLNIKDELNSAIKCIKEKEFNQVYLAYPKYEGFTKHIPIVVDELKNKQYQIKAIPYSLRSIIRNK